MKEKIVNLIDLGSSVCAAAGKRTTKTKYIPIRMDIHTFGILNLKFDI